MPAPVALETLCAIAREAGDIIMEHYRAGAPGAHIASERKDDDSPVTLADLAANRHIVAALRMLTPDTPIIAEEGGFMEQEAVTAPAFWLVDPLDGTKSFITRKGEFTVNIGLIKNKQPVQGVVYVPVEGMLYAGDVTAHRAFRQKDGGAPEPMATRTPPAGGFDVVMSKSHLTPETEAFIQKLNVRSTVAAASSLKLCAVACGEADVYPRFGRTMEWDIAAGHAVLLAAGGRLETPEGAPFAYQKPDFANGYFVAWGK